jgi:hypothetical protein
VELLDTGARAGPDDERACMSIRPRLDREVLAAIDRLGPGRWRHTLRDVQLGKMSRKGFPRMRQQRPFHTRTLRKFSSASRMNAHVPRQLSSTAIIHAEDSVTCRGKTVKLTRQTNCSLA